MVSQYNINFPDKLWDEFKSTVPKSKTLNDQLIELVEKFVRDKKNEI